MELPILDHICRRCFQYDLLTFHIVRCLPPEQILFYFELPHHLIEYQDNTVFEDFQYPQFNEEVQHLEKRPYGWYSGWIWKKDTST